MSFRPRNYQDALDFINRRRDKYDNCRVISRNQLRKGAPSEIRDSLVAHTDDPESTYGDNPPPISFRQWSTNIATFYADGSVAIDPHDSPTTRERMNDMGLPSTRSPAVVGMTKNQIARLCTSPYARQELKGFRYGVPLTTHRVYLLDADNNLHPNQEGPTEDIYVEATPGAHKQYQLGRKRLLRALKEYAAMVNAVGSGSWPRMGRMPPATRKYLLHVCKQCPSLGQIREEVLPEVIHTHEPAGIEALYHAVKEQLGLYDLTSDRDLWERKTVNSAELDQWL